ncbi:MAG: SCP2 sterol-binding domain-containing protein [Betaproteobacteria bacterium]|nr:SCP2 sterol-binding domain-containing protein [Betaproteobacteria bacterium]MDH5212036.1 SCP2 sterol-binding domain-containing protein [Betaproteobacteria bacterium]
MILPPGALRSALQPLRGKVLRLEIAGLGFGPQFTLDAIGLRPAFGKPDVTVRASLGDYFALALRREDPDTLFFTRRLVIEGDTGLGLEIKNALDALG